MSNLNLGMSLKDTIDLLGKPTDQLGGNEFQGMLAGSTLSQKPTNEKIMYLWDKPEGEYILTFQNDVLIEINRKP